MLKRGLALLLALVMLASVSVAGAAWSEVKVDGHHKYVSVADWSKADIEKAIKLNLDVAYTGENVQMSIARVDFAEDAAALVGLAYGQDIRTYERYNELQVLLNKAEKKDVWREMGILKGRGNGYYVDPNTPITRQEAAVVLARVYRLYAEEPQTKASLTYQDAKDIADWAKDDVALMTQLGVMNGVAKGKFDPKGQYTVEQCLVTLVRLYEKTAQGKTPVGTYPLQLGQRETVIGQTWEGSKLYRYEEKAGVTVIAANDGGGQSTRWYITVIDQNNKGKVYRNVIKRKYSASSAYDAPLERMTLSADGSQVIYQSTLETDAVDKTGKVQFPKGRYTVTIDVAKGEQTYTRADLPETTEGTAPDGSKFTVSAGAKQEVESALALGLTEYAPNKNYRKPVQRDQFASNALKIAGLAFGEDVSTYAAYQGLQAMIAEKEPTRLTTDLGIYSFPAGMSSENHYAYSIGEITRQEAAGMLARAYHIYSGEVHDNMEPLTYTDKADIADNAKADVQLMTHLGVMTDVGDGRFDPEGPYSVEDSLVGLYRLYQNTCVGKKPDQPDIFYLTPRQKQITQAYSSGSYATSAENDATFAIVYSENGGHMGPTSTYVWVVDAKGTCQRYRNVIKSAHDIYWGEGEWGMTDASIEKIWLSDDGSKVYYQSTVKEDVYPYYPNGTYGKLLFAKGVYTVTLDVATGKQTYTRADLT